MVTLPMRTAPPAPARGRRSGRDHGRGGMAVLAAAVILLGAGGAAWAWWVGSVGSVPLRENCTATASGNSTSLAPDQAGNAAIITAIAVHRGLPGRAASIAIATAMQESKLRNVQYGDLDSLGLFQQRPSQGWGTKAQILDPVHATNAFYDRLVKIKGYVNMPITEVAQKIQRSAYPTAYANHEPQARVIASTLSGYSPAGLSCVLHAAGVSAPGGTGGADAAGYLPATQTLVSAAARETGRAAAAPLSGGRSVRFDTGTSTGNRSAWSLGQWAVARGDGLAVTVVQVGDRQWQRAHSTDGWTTLANPEPAGTVVVTTTG